MAKLSPRVSQGKPLFTYDKFEEIVRKPKKLSKTMGGGRKRSRDFYFGKLDVNTTPVILTDPSDNDSVRRSSVSPQKGSVTDDKENEQEESLSEKSRSPKKRLSFGSKSPIISKKEPFTRSENVLPNEISDDDEEDLDDIESESEEENKNDLVEEDNLHEKNKRENTEEEDDNEEEAEDLDDIESENEEGKKNDLVEENNLLEKNEKENTEEEEDDEEEAEEETESDSSCVKSPLKKGTSKFLNMSPILKTKSPIINKGTPSPLYTSLKNSPQKKNKSNLSPARVEKTYSRSPKQKTISNSPKPSLSPMRSRQKNTSDIFDSAITKAKVAKLQRSMEVQAGSSRINRTRQKREPMASAVPRRLTRSQCMASKDVPIASFMKELDKTMSDVGDADAVFSPIRTNSPQKGKKQISTLAESPLKGKERDSSSAASPLKGKKQKSVSTGSPEKNNKRLKTTISKSPQKRTKQVDTSISKKDNVHFSVIESKKQKRLEENILSLSVPLPEPEENDVTSQSNNTLNRSVGRKRRKRLSMPKTKPKKKKTESNDAESTQILDEKNKSKKASSTKAVRFSMDSPGKSLKKSVQTPVVFDYPSDDDIDVDDESMTNETRPSSSSDKETSKQKSKKQPTPHPAKTKSRIVSGNNDDNDDHEMDGEMIDVELSSPPHKSRSPTNKSLSPRKSISPPRKSPSSTRKSKRTTRSPKKQLTPHSPRIKNRKGSLQTDEEEEEEEENSDIDDEVDDQNEPGPSQSKPEPKRRSSSRKSPIPYALRRSRNKRRSSSSNGKNDIAEENEEDDVSYDKGNIFENEKVQRKRKQISVKNKNKNSQYTSEELCIPPWKVDWKPSKKGSVEDKDVLLHRSLRVPRAHIGQLKILANKTKGWNKVKKDTLVLYVLKGPLKVFIENEHWMAVTGEMFKIPEGCRYNLANTTDSACRLLFISCSVD